MSLEDKTIDKGFFADLEWDLTKNNIFGWCNVVVKHLPVILLSLHPDDIKFVTEMCSVIEEIQKGSERFKLISVEKEKRQNTGEAVGLVYGEKTLGRVLIIRISGQRNLVGKPADYYYLSFDHDPDGKEKYRPDQEDGFEVAPRKVDISYHPRRKESGECFLTVRTVISNLPGNTFLERNYSFCHN